MLNIIQKAEKIEIEGNMHKNNKKNDLIDEDQKKLAFNYSIFWL